MKMTACLFLMFVAINVQARITPADGLWGTTDNPAIGSGLMLITQNGITVVSVFTYDADGNNIWYLASGQVDENNVLEAELLLASNGSNILNDNPAPAEFIGTPRTIKIEFAGSQIGAMSIDGSTPKIMQASHFGFDINQLILDLRGQWVLGEVDSGMSYVLDLEWVDVIQSPITPVSIVSYQSVHPSTMNWNLSCYGFGTDITALDCYVTRGPADQLPPLKIDVEDLGNQRMTLVQNEAAPFETYQAFRLNNDRRLLPNDGYWRPADDPAIGSGLVMRTQGEFTVILMYTYDSLGKAKWQIASGQFDEAGKLVTSIMKSNGGSAIESTDPTSATFLVESDVLEIQLEGLELATFSINGSEPKYIQNLNYGLPLVLTKHFEVNEVPFKFPLQNGRWVMVDSAQNVSTVMLLNEFSGTISPLPPTLPMIYQNNLHDQDDHYSLIFNCHRNVFTGIIPTCTGYGGFVSQDQDDDLKIYFQDIGYGHFRMYFGEGIDAIDRSSQYFDLYRLSD